MKELKVGERVTIEVVETETATCIGCVSSIARTFAMLD